MAAAVVLAGMVEYCLATSFMGKKPAGMYSMAESTRLRFSSVKEALFLWHYSGSSRMDLLCIAELSQLLGIISRIASAALSNETALVSHVDVKIRYTLLY